MYLLKVSPYDRICGSGSDPCTCTLGAAVDGIPTNSIQPD